jgi:hypothetical protein
MGKAESMFFFEKRNQKTFAFWAYAAIAQWAAYAR